MEVAARLDIMYGVYISIRKYAPKRLEPENLPMISSRSAAPNRSLLSVESPGLIYEKSRW